MSRRRWLFLGGGALLAALVVGGLTLGQRTPAPGDRRGVGQLAPDFSLPRLGGDGTVGLAAVRGRPVVVNFFASWCVPCRQEMPALQAVSSKLGDRVAFLGVDHQDDRAGALQLLAETGVRYPTGYDPEGTVAARYGLFGMPTTLFVGADGRLLDKHTGPLSADGFEATITRLFGA